MTTVLTDRLTALHAQHQQAVAQLQSVRDAAVKIEGQMELLHDLIGEQATADAVQSHANQATETPTDTTALTA